ncbi:MAG: hypothetical protein ACLP01_09560, partial [Solirubrobacteraceae bacterium]
MFKVSESNGSANGSGRYQEDKVRVAIIGVGNCASSFVQGVQYYRDADPKQAVPGLMHVDLGGYHVRDIEFSAAFDIDVEKVGKDLSQAIYSGQNNTLRFAGEVPSLGVPVNRGMTHDGLGKYLSQKITKAPGPTADIVDILKETHTDVVVSYLPVGSEQATKWYVEQILDAGCGMVNCIPVFIAREEYWNKRFRKVGLPIIGDDIKSQVGATIVHRQLARLFHERGVKLMRTSQLNVGGNMVLDLAISQGPSWGWTSPAVLGSLGAASLLAAAFLVRSSHHAEPVLDLGLFRSRSFSVANLATLLYAMGFFAMLLGNILFLTSVWGYSILVAGLAVTPGPLVVAVVSGPAGKLAGRIGFRPVLLVGFAIFASGLAWFALRVGLHREYLTVWLPATLIVGLGIGLTFPILSAAAVSSLHL